VFSKLNKKLFPNNAEQGLSEAQLNKSASVALPATTGAPPIRPAASTVNLVVATPCFGGQISVLYAASLFKLQKLVRSYDDFNLKILFKAMR
jgi:hypothetical protein